VDLLVGAGALVDSLDVDNATPFLHASNQGNLDCLRNLVAKGANIEAKDSDGVLTAIIFLTKKGFCTPQCGI
jgi:ankyrin repeat protein